VRLTVLGKSPSWQDADGACSGYLIEEDGTTVLLDCGNGVFSKLRRFRDYTKVDAVVISHLHSDHFLDLVPFSRMRRASSPCRLIAGTERRRPPAPSCTRPAAPRSCSGAWSAPGATTT
jgi:ribonuclease BN (tRNA processing enzyme)